MNSQWRGAFKRRGAATILPPGAGTQPAGSGHAPQEPSLISLQWSMDQCLPSGWVPVNHPLPPPTAPQPETRRTDTSVRDTVTADGKFSIPVNYLSRVKAITDRVQGSALGPPCSLRGAACFLTIWIVRSMAHRLPPSPGQKGEPPHHLGMLRWILLNRTVSITSDFPLKLVPPQLTTFPPDLCERQPASRVSHKFPLWAEAEFSWSVGSSFFWARNALVFSLSWQNEWTTLKSALSGHHPAGSCFHHGFPLTVDRFRSLVEKHHEKSSWSCHQGGCFCMKARGSSARWWN